MLSFLIMPDNLLLHQTTGEALSGTVDVTISGWGEALGVVDGAAHLQAGAHAVDGARAGLVLLDLAGITRVAVHALAGAVMAETTLVALVFAGLEGAVVSGVAGCAGALTVDASARVGAVAWADDGAAAVTTKPWAAEACAIEAMALG